MSATPAALTDTDRLVVVGASLAGLRAVEAARKAGFGGPVTLIGLEKHLPYDRPPLSKALLEADSPAEPVTFREEEHLLVDLDVDLLLGQRAVGLDTAARTVRVRDVATGEERDVAYSALVIATGAAARTLPGTEGLAGVHTLRTLDDGLAVRAALDAGARTVVVGAGFIGSEVASGVRARGGEVTIVEAEPTPLVRAAGRAMGAGLSALHAAHGTTLLTGIAVAEVESADGAVTAVRLADGTHLPADLVVVGIGASPCTDWLEGSGVELHDRDRGVVCDATLATSVPGIWAAGDVAHWPNQTVGVTHRLEHWTSAAEQGACAARNALDPAAASTYGTVPYFWSDWYGSRIQFVGTPQADEVRLVDGELGESRWIALFRRGDALVGALTLNGQTEVMKYRAQIMKGATFDSAVEFAATRAAKRAAAAS